MDWMGYDSYQKRLPTHCRRRCSCNFITSDSSAKAIPSDITEFLHLSLREQVKEIQEGVESDVKKQLGVQTEKEKFVDKLKDMTKEEIINYLQTDTAAIKK